LSGADAALTGMASIESKAINMIINMVNWFLVKKTRNGYLDTETVLKSAAKLIVYPQLYFDRVAGGNNGSRGSWNLPRLLNTLQLGTCTAPEFISYNLVYTLSFKLLKVCLSNV
jgi:hypothetical protein